MGSTKATLAVAIACIAVVALLSIPAILHHVYRLIGKRSKYQQISDLYEDEDGTATEESQEAYSDFVQRLLLILVSAVGAAASLILAIVAATSLGPSLILEQWLQFGTWGFVFLQAVTVFVTPRSVDRYAYGIYGAGSCLLLLVAIIVENTILWQAEIQPLRRDVHLTLSIVQCGSASILMIVNLLIPRRPDVYYNEKVVDRVHTVSVLEKYTFAWATSTLRAISTNKTFETQNLPYIDHASRSLTLRKDFDAVGKKDKLWKILFWSHKWAFITQWTLQAISCFTNFAPQIALYFILRTLEDRQAGVEIGLKAWLLVLGLAASVTVSSWLESWMFFIVFMRIGIPVFEQLAAVVFDKSVRRKDVKGTSKDVKDETNGSGDAVTAKTISSDEDDKNEDEEDDNPQKSKQSIINLVGVDSKRVADFATFNYVFMGSVLKLVLALSFLTKLIGWLPLLAGFAAPVLITPINALAVRRYAHYQDRLMKYRDQKMAIVTEALQGIRQVKFSALEKEWYDKILAKREQELRAQWQCFLADTAVISIWIFTPVALSAISLATYAIINKELTASVAFTTISVFEAIEMTLSVVPEMVSDLLEALVSSRRIQEYLDSPELERTLKSGDTIEFEAATVAWPSDDPVQDENRFVLHDLNLVFPNNQLSVVSGRTGSGKSLLLATIIGEAEVMAGTVQVPKAVPASERFDPKATPDNWYIEGAIAYVAQIPWIENASIKNNILFGLPLNENRYKEVMHDCALEKDLEMLSDGDQTDIGANGINLSGGQKWRVSFARALYSRAKILVLDDIFSAVDAHVGRHLFEKALTGKLGQGRSRILVTHHVALCLPETQYSVILGNGTVEYAGSIDDLRKSGKLKLLLAYDIEEQRKADEKAEQEAITVDEGGGTLQKMFTNQSHRARRTSTLSQAENIHRTRSHATIEEGKKDTAPKKFTEDETKESGAIKLVVYANYIRACGGFFYWSVILFFFVVWIVVYLARSYWISVWTRSYHTESDVLHQLFRQPGNIIHHMRPDFQSVAIDSELAYYLGVYVAISMAAWMVGSIRYFLVFFASIRASKILFQNLASTILRAPLRWLDTVPLGRILNRFTADFNMLDSKVAIDIAFMLHNVVSVISVVIASVFVSPFMLIFAAVLLGLCLYFALQYLHGAREVKRLESNAKSPVFEQFGSVLTGIGTIRAFDKTETYLEHMYQKIDTHCRAYWHLWLFNRWLGWRLNMIGAVFAFITAALIVSIRTIDAALAGFALSFALNLSDSVIWMLRQYANVELDMNATERIFEYSNLKTEDQGGDNAPAAWPSQGEVEVSDLVVAYAPDLTPVLKGLSFRIERNQRVGVVGRTGAGKSSLTLALFRFLEARSGSIYIDGIDISKIKLYDLRSRLAIIPQDPVLFSGTVRSNLDPFDQHGDNELREALARVQLISSSASAGASGTATPIPAEAGDAQANKNVFRSLSSKISEGGLNLSQGQRQLLCLARAIVSRPKVMVLDEATSAVDMETDALIQRSIREEFQDSTLLVIAHRLSTIADFDRILVMGDGKVLEYDTPKNLMDKPDGHFKKMVEESGERTELEALINRNEQT